MFLQQFQLLHSTELALVGRFDRQLHLFEQRLARIVVEKFPVNEAVLATDRVLIATDVPPQIVVLRPIEEGAKRL